MDAITHATRDHAPVTANASESQKVPQWASTFSRYLHETVM